MVRVTETEHNEPYMSAQWRFRFAYAYVQSYQSLRCTSEDALGPWIPIERQAKTDQT